MIFKRAADIDRLLAAPPQGLRAALIYGRDRGGVRERAQMLAAKVSKSPNDPFNSAQLTDSEVEEGGRLPDELAALSMFGGRRLVTVRLSGDRAGADRATAEALKAHLAFDAEPDAFLLIEAGNLGGASPTRRTAEADTAGRAAVLAVYEDESGDLARIAREALLKDGVRLTTEALTLFASRLPSDRGVTRQEIERLVLFVGPDASGAVTAEQLEPFFGVEADASLADAALDACGGGLNTALAHLRRAFSEGEAGPAAVAAAARHLQRLRRVNVLTHNGVAPQTALKQAGVFWKQEREVGRQARAWSDIALDACQARVLAADLACKRTESPDTLIAERLYMTLAGTARRAGL